MEWLLDNPQQAAKLRAELESWRDTPWYHSAGSPGKNLAVRGLRGDCVTIIAACYQQCGFIEPVLIPAHPPFTGLSKETDEEQTLSKMLQDLVMDGILAPAPRPFRFGDLLTFRYSAREHHLGVYDGISKMFWHCGGPTPASSKFCLANLMDGNHRRGLRHAYRLVQR